MADVLMDLTEAGKTTDAAVTKAIRSIIVEEEPLLEYIKWEKLPAGQSSYKYFQERRLPTTSFRAVNSGWDSDRSIVIPRQENLAILGGEVKIDTFIQDTMGGLVNGTPKANEFARMARSAKIEWLEAFFEGDSGVDPNSFEGLRTRIDGTALNFDMSSGTDRAVLTLEKLDEVLDAVIMGPNVLCMNQFLRRKVNALMRAAGQSQESVSTTFGKQIPKYADVPMLVIQRGDNMTSILDFDEDPGDGGDDTASIYAIRFGEDYVFGILGNGGAWEVKDFGEMQADPQILGRLSVYVGLVTMHPRSYARLHSIGEL